MEDTVARDNKQKKLRFALIIGAVVATAFIFNMVVLSWRL